MLFLYIITYLVFFYINALIIISDIKKNIIPNKYLLILFILSITYLIACFFMWLKIGWIFFVQIILSFFVAFILYYNSIWSAWDAKYMLVLALYIPKEWIIPFVWNICIVLIMYLFLFCVIFYIWVLFNKHFRKSLFSNILIDQKDKFNLFVQKEDWNRHKKVDIILKLLKSAAYFILFFVFVRLFRTEIIDEISRIWYIKNNLKTLGSYLIFWWWILGFYIMFSYRFLFNKIKSLLINIVKYKLKLKIDIPEYKLKIINVVVVIILLAWIILYDYMRIWKAVFHQIYLILTLYLAMSLFIRMLMYWYRLTFQIWEQDYISVDKLKIWDVVDIEYLIKLFWTQVVLWYWKKENISFLKTEPIKYLKMMDNPINKEWYEDILNIYKTVNSYHKDNDSNYIDNTTIKILKTFAFAPYVFIWFLMTFLYWDSFWKYMINIVGEIIVKIKNWG